jgi:hypothetical protein
VVDVLGVGDGVVGEGLGEQVVLVAGDLPLTAEDLGELAGGPGRHLSSGSFAPTDYIVRWEIDQRRGGQR